MWKNDEIQKKYWTSSEGNQYTVYDAGGMNVNEFEQEVQSKNNDVVDSIKGFGFSFLFFFIIFFIGTIFQVVGS